MALTPEQFARAAAFEAHQERLVRLQRMSYRELQVLLTGDPEEAAAWVDRKSTRLNSSHVSQSRMPSSA